MSWRSRVKASLLQDEERSVEMPFTVLTHKIIGPALHNLPKQTAVVTPIQHNPNLPAVIQKKEGVPSWSKEKILKYINDLRVKGFKEGAKVRTRFNREGIISELGVDDEMLFFLNTETPDIIKLDMGHTASPTWLYYNEAELTLITDGEK